MAALQTVDLATGERLTEAVKAQCLAEGVTSFEPVVRALAPSALDSDVVETAAARPHWRETYVGSVRTEGEHAGKVLEGFVDLIYRDDDGQLVIIDYKTDAVEARGHEPRADHYGPQLAAYAAILQATKSHAAGPAMVLRFLSPRTQSRCALRRMSRTRRDRVHGEARDDFN